MLKFKEYSTELDAVVETTDLAEDEIKQLDEVLDTAARLKKKQFFLRRKAKNALARKLQAKRLASTERLKGRATNRAKSVLIKRLFQGRSRSEIPLSQRAAVDAKLAKMKGTIKRVAGKLLRRVKADDIARKTGHSHKSSGSAGAL